MSWVLKEGMLLAMRDARGLSLGEVSAGSGLTVRQIQRLEKGEHNPRESSVIGIARFYECKPTVFAERSEGKPPAAAGGVRTGEETTLAKREFERGLAQQTIKVAGRVHPLIGFNRLQHCEASYLDIDETFAIVGTVRERMDIPSDAAAFLEAAQGRGAGLFRVRRDVEGLGRGKGTVPLPVSVYAAGSREGGRLLRSLERETPVTVLMKIVVARKGRQPRACFPRCEPASALWPWAFVVTEVIEK